MKKMFIAAFFCIAVAGFASEESKMGHTKSGTSYVDNQIKNYASAGHGSDDQLFLDPYIDSELKLISGKSVLDAGCGAAPWSIIAARNGAQVCGIDLQKGMIEIAQAAVARAGMENKITLTEGNVENLPFEAITFDQALSINIGCNLPATTHVLTDTSFQVTGLGAHFREIARVLKEEGTCLITAPASFAIVFTDGNCDTSEVATHIDEVLGKIENCDDADAVMLALGDLKEVLRATFVKRDGKLVLVTDEKELRIGEPIWRKIPDCVVPNYYHSEEEYLVALKNAGLTCEEIKRPCFFGNVKYKAYRTSLKEGEKCLGQAYIDHHPFTIYYVTKRA